MLIAHFFKPEKFADGEAAKASREGDGKKTFFENLKEIDALLAGKQWIMGDQFTVADPYALVFYGWGVRAELPMQELTDYTAWKDRMLAAAGGEESAGERRKACCVETA